MEAVVVEEAVPLLADIVLFMIAPLLNIFYSNIMNPLVNGKIQIVILI